MTSFQVYFIPDGKSTPSQIVKTHIMLYQTPKSHTFRGCDCLFVASHTPPNTPGALLIHDDPPRDEEKNILEDFLMAAADAANSKNINAWLAYKRIAEQNEANELTSKIDHLRYLQQKALQIFYKSRQQRLLEVEDKINELYDLLDGELKEGELKEGELKEGELKEGELKEGELKEGELKEGVSKEAMKAAWELHTSLVSMWEEGETKLQGYEFLRQRVNFIQERVTGYRGRIYSVIFLLSKVKETRGKGDHILLAVYKQLLLARDYIHSLYQSIERATQRLEQPLQQNHKLQICRPDIYQLYCLCASLFLHYVESPVLEDRQR
ncbi:hypothetical protein TEQG_02485 [Trichophyton equinum CBS 127.97]|uniref:Uncharacterized protein n=1 Tax=Trichophyton equinum (strain ATCC MYA-4606 / CBS 127.97) TaxID=559882 RepID=F2PNI1_TRIEC|nr:hypothetical protein TEQG_02485 [Trichophyton equinum CBS 127.97]